MNIIKRSFAVALTVSSVFAGEEITPIVKPVIEVAACNSNTTIKSKVQAYYYTFEESTDLFSKESSQLGTAVTLDVSHKIIDGITANFTAVGFTNLTDDGGYMEDDETGAFMNVANITATFGDTTLIAGRQLIDTPMLGSFYWLLAPSAFEAYSFTNASIPNLTLVSHYITKWRPNNSGGNFLDVTDVGDGQNWAVGAVYNDSFDASVWYYHVDYEDYVQFYADATIELLDIKLSGQFANTDYNSNPDDSTAFGVKVSTLAVGFIFTAAYNSVADNVTRFDSFYASSWNIFASHSVGDAFKVEAASEFSGVSAKASYAYYAYEQYDDKGHEIDLLLSYKVTDDFSIETIYSNTDYGLGDDTDAFELIATYKF